MQVTIGDIIAAGQIIGLPILILIYKMGKKAYRGSVLNGLKITSLVHALQKENNNGLTIAYEKKLEQLKDDINWIEDK